ncbi:MAG: biotin attachment protein, partial [Spirochaetales bacterium]|nr:biotin attachment protein [Spirochaetales bacterium]
EFIVDAGLRHEVSVTLMGLPPGLSGAHSAEFYLDRLTQILDTDIPMHSLALKDASGTATPQVVYETVQLAKKKLPGDVPVRFHTHDTAGTGVVTYRAAVEAGADGIDLSMAPVSGGTAQPDIITMWHALRGTEFDLGVDIEKVMEAEEVFKDCMRDYFFPPEALRVEPLIPFSPMPGGALTANTQMMRDHKVLHRFPDVIAAMREVVERGGFATSVTPVSQFYFQQAFNNVVMGPWKKIADGYGKMLLGYFGKTPSAPDPELVRIAGEQLGLEPTSESPRLLNDADPTKGRSAAEAILREEGLPITDENVFIAATCKERGITFLKGEARPQIRKNGSEGVEAPAPSGAPSPTAQPGTGPAAYTVTVSGQTFAVIVADGTAVVDGQTHPLPSGTAAAPAPVASPPPQAGAATISAPMPGVILRTLVKAGDVVAEGTPVVLMECMKMEMKVEASSAGTVSQVHVTDGQSVEADAALVSIA